MAEAALSNTIVEDFLTCTICFELFKEPKILPCLHTFCFLCLKKLVDGSSSKVLRCPKCRNESPIPQDGASGIKTNFYIVNLAEVIQTKDVSSTATLCSFCIAMGDNVTALFRCLDCPDSLCKTCAERHTFTRLTMNHRVVDFGEVRSGKYDDQLRSSQGVFCPIHKQEKIRYFCETCDKTVCRDCVLLLHQSHNCMTTEDALKSRKGSIENLMEEVEKCLRMHTKNEQDLSKQMTVFEHEEQQLYALTSKIAERVIQKVQQEENKINMKIRQCYIKPKEDMIKTTKEHKDASEMLRESLAFCRNIIQNGKDVEILALQDLLRKRLSYLQSISRKSNTYVSDQKHAQIKLNPCFEENLNLFMYSESISGNKEIKNVAGLNSSIEQQMNVIKSSSNTTHEGKQQATKVCNTKYTSKADAATGETLVKVSMEVQFCTRKFCRLNFIKTFSNCWGNSKYEPKLTSVAWMDSSKFAVADNNNDCVRIFDVQGQLLSSTTVTMPVTLTVCNKNIICFSENVLHIIQEDGKVRKKEMTKGSRLYPVTAKGENFLVGNIERGTITEFSGEKVIKSIKAKDANNKTLDFECFALCTNKVGNIAISDKQRSRILFVRKDGLCKNLFDCYQKADNRPCWQPGAISIDRYDNVFNVCYQKSRLYVLSPDGSNIAVSKFQDKLEHPRSLAISDDNDLLVTDSSGNIILFKIQYSD